jgi:hypothetical protein
MKTKKFILSCFACLIYLTCLCNEPLPTTNVSVDFSIPYSFLISPNSVIIPFNAVSGLVVIKGSVNQIEGNFIVDSGANGLVLNNRYFKPDRLLANSEGVGVSGSTSEVGIAKLDSLNVDELVFLNTKAQTIDLRQLENRKKTRILGLIGYDILKDFEIMFDYRQRFLTFSKTDKKGNILTTLPHTNDKVDSVSFNMGNHLPIIEVKVGNKKKIMGIDTGAEYNMLNIKRSKNIMSNFKILKTIEITGAGKKPIEALAGKLYRVVLKKKYKCGGMSTVTANFKDIERIYGTRLDGILGYEFLAPWIFSINYKKKQLFLHKLEFNRP